MSWILKYRTSVLLIFIGLVSTLVKYKFGVDDQLDHLLFVNKAMDSNFLESDWYVSVTSHFTVRTYFAHFVAFFAHFLGVELSFFILTLFSNIALSASTFLVAKHLFNNHLSAYISSIIVMTVPSVNMGDFSNLFATGLAPDRLAIPLIGFAFYFILKRQLYVFAIFAGIASLFHILFGLIVGSVLWLAFILFNKIVQKQKVLLVNIWPVVIIWLFGLFTMLPLFLSSGQSISSKEFVDIYVFFRVPHHIVPSVIYSNGIGYRAIFFFCGVFVVVYQLLKGNFTAKANLILWGIITVLFALICWLGYFFVEMYPSRLGAFLQAFRYLTMVKWMAYILVGSFIGILLDKKKNRMQGIILLLSFSSTILFLVFVLGHSFHDVLKEKWIKTEPLKYLFPLLLLVYFIVRGSFNETIILMALVILVLIHHISTSKVSFFLMATYLSLIILNSCLPFPVKTNVKTIDNWLKKNYRPVFEFSELANSKISMSMYIKDNLPLDAVLISPPDFSQIAAIANRGNVISFKLVPFKDMDIKEWKDRLDFCYGKTKASGFNAENELVANYEKMSESKLEEIKLRYACDYAVLPKSSTINFPLIYSNNEYKLFLIP